MSETLAVWMERQYRHSAVAMMRSVSAVGIVKTRPGFAQTVRPRKGSIVASPVLGAYDPEPDYFFHWFRDSAVVIDAVRILFEDHARDGEVMLAFQMNGEQLPLLNGFPVRLIVPGWYSDYWVKMLSDIEVLDAPDGNYFAPSTKGNCHVYLN